MEKTNHSLDSKQRGVLLLNTEVKVTFYRSHLFADAFREYFSVPYLLKKSLSVKYNREMVFKAGEGAGRSGSFFFFSHDSKFLIKTMNKTEISTYLRLCRRFIKHYKENPHSLIARIFGVFRVQITGMEDIYVLLMENTMRVKQQENLMFSFDLKGSLIARETK